MVPLNEDPDKVYIAKYAITRGVEKASQYGSKLYTEKGALFIESAFGAITRVARRDWDTNAVKVSYRVLILIQARKLAMTRERERLTLLGDHAYEVISETRRLTCVE